MNFFICCRFFGKYLEYIYKNDFKVEELLFIVKFDVRF